LITNASGVGVKPAASTAVRSAPVETTATATTVPMAAVAVRKYLRKDFSRSTSFAVVDQIASSSAQSWDPAAPEYRMR
jgi:hypothetical protein